MAVRGDELFQPFLDCPSVQNSVLLPGPRWQRDQPPAHPQPPPLGPSPPPQESALSSNPLWQPDRHPRICNKGKTPVCRRRRTRHPRATRAAVQCRRSDWPGQIEFLGDNPTIQKSLNHTCGICVPCSFPPFLYVVLLEGAGFLLVPFMNPATQTEFLSTDIQDPPQHILYCKLYLSCTVHFTHIYSMWG